MPYRTDDLEKVIVAVVWVADSRPPSRRQTKSPEQSYDMRHWLKRVASEYRFAS
jgi:hypothetical protein